MPPSQSVDPLASRTWQVILKAENSAQYTEELDSETLTLQAKNLAVVRAKIPPGYPEPYLPYGRLKNTTLDFQLAREPFLSPEIIDLGKNLFAETGLSYTARHGFGAGISCAVCHVETQVFTDGKKLSKGAEGDETRRNTPTLYNAAYNSTLTWANPVFPALEMQAKIPLFGDDPIEMGLKGRENELSASLLGTNSGYAEQIEKIFGLKGDSVDYTVITTAIAAYERTLINFDTKFDRFLQGRLRTDERYDDAEKEGLELFYGMKALQSGDTLPCAQCHSGVLLSNSFQFVRNGRYYNRQSFHNTGLYNLDGKGAYPFKNTGFATESQLRTDPSLMGQFRVPGLRFVGLTAPYAHDGSQDTLDSIIRDYAAGGRSKRSGEGQNPYVDPLIKKGFSINDAEIATLVKFLNTLQ
ncbi:MAG: di-heme enzyme [Chitinophagaceae bacterium]|nr:di-heme enzyme [Oligoflexus sp.]